MSFIHHQHRLGPWKGQGWQAGQGLAASVPTSLCHGFAVPFFVTSHPVSCCLLCF